MNLKLIGAAAVALLVVAPTMAAQRVDHHRHAYRTQTRNFDYRSVYDAYGFYPDGGLAPGNAFGGDFDRKNTFN